LRKSEDITISLPDNDFPSHLSASGANFGRVAAI
jgi:hypothetical protein